MRKQHDAFLEKLQSIQRGEQFPLTFDEKVTHIAQPYMKPHPYNNRKGIVKCVNALEARVEERVRSDSFDAHTEHTFHVTMFWDIEDWKDAVAKFWQDRSRDDPVCNAAAVEIQRHLDTLQEEACEKIVALWEERHPKLQVQSYGDFILQIDLSILAK